MWDQSTDGSTDASTVQARGGDQSTLYTVGVAIGLGILGPALAAVFVIALTLANQQLQLPQLVTFFLGLFFGQYVAFAGLALAYLAFRGLDLGGIKAYLGVEWPTLDDVILIIGAWIGILGAVIIVGLLVQSAGTEPASNQSAELAQNNPSIIPLLILASFLVIGPCEEILYRGAVQGRLREALDAAPAIIISSALFASIHFLALTGGASARLLTIAILFIPSLVLGWVYEHTGNIVVNSLLHGLHNAFLLSMIYLTL
jgi:hypothetical protein